MKEYPITIYEERHNNKFPKTPISVVNRIDNFIYFNSEFGVCKKFIGEFGKSDFDIRVAINKTEYFINQANKAHNFKYSYENVDYITSKSRMKIVCPIHGVFEQMAHHHLSGHGCRKCASIESNKKNSIIMSNWALKDWAENAVNSKNFDSLKVYSLKLWNENENFYKIGRTYQKVKRRFRAKVLMPYEYKILKIFEGDAKSIYTLEIDLKKLNKINKYTPKIKFGGMFECYSKIKLLE